MKLGQAFDKIRSDSELAKKFEQDPEGVLTDLGVDTAGLKIQKGQDAQAPALKPPSFCVNVGCIACVNIGT